MSGRAAGKLKQKKDGRPKNVLGAHFFPLLQMYLFHPFLLLINSLPPSPAAPLNPQNSAFISLRPGRPLPYHRLPPSLKAPLSVRGGGCGMGGLQTPSSSSASCLPALSSVFFSELSHQQCWALGASGFTGSAVHRKISNGKWWWLMGIHRVLALSASSVNSTLDKTARTSVFFCCCCCYKKKVMSVYRTSDHLLIWQW